jgi:hypothetical protein
MFVFISFIQVNEGHRIHYDVLASDDWGEVTLHQHNKYNKNAFNSV